MKVIEAEAERVEGQAILPLDRWAVAYFATIPMQWFMQVGTHPNEATAIEGAHLALDRAGVCEARIVHITAPQEKEHGNGEGFLLGHISGLLVAAGSEKSGRPYLTIAVQKAPQEAKP